MTVTLYIGDYATSSWSLRGWLLLDAFGIEASVQHRHMGTPEFAAMQARMAPARLVPALSLGGVMVWESLAIAETVHERWPDAGLWPADPDRRAAARSLAAEMHAGFGALRRACPMNLCRAYSAFAPDPEVRADLERLEALWDWARADEGPYLFGAFSAADAFFVPVASRIATYDLPVSPSSARYAAALLAHPSARRWRAMAAADPRVMARYEIDLPARTPDPQAVPGGGVAVTGGVAENAACPFTGGTPDCLARIGGSVLGFATEFERDKAMADPGAWPQLSPWTDPASG